MDYKKIHDQIILRAKNRQSISGYFERHHVTPKSMGGNDAMSNMVKLTAREHYLIHWLLFKIHKNNEMCFAWYRMTHFKKGVNRYTSRTFEYAKKYRAKHMSKMFSGKELSECHIEKLRKAKEGKAYDEIGRGESPLKGRNLSDDHKRKVGLAGQGKKRSQDVKAKMSEAKKGDKNHRFGKPVSEETRKKLSEALRAYKKSNPMSDETKKKLSESMKAALESKYLSSSRANTALKT